MKRKTLTGIIIGITICFLGFLVWVIYFVNLMTPKSAVIKAYSYSGGVNDFISHVQMYCSRDSSTAFKITDTTGTDETGHAIYIDIELKDSAHDILYSIVCERNNKSPTSTTSVELAFGFDKINKIGGYNKEAKGIQPLVNYFDANFLTPLSNNQNINITALE